MELSDAALVEACLNGGVQSYEELVRRHQDSVYNLAYRMTNNAHDAADLAQETFLRAYRKLATYRPRYAFRNWILTICANLAKNRFRKTARRREAEAAHAELQDLSRPVRSDVGHDVADALHRLEQKFRVPLVLKHVEGLSYEEISQILGIGISAAKMRVKRGRARLLAIVQVEGGARHGN